MTPHAQPNGSNDVHLPPQEAGAEAGPGPSFLPSNRQKSFEFGAHEDGDGSGNAAAGGRSSSLCTCGCHNLIETPANSIIASTLEFTPEAAPKGVVILIYPVHTDPSPCVLDTDSLRAETAPPADGGGQGDVVETPRAFSASAAPGGTHGGPPRAPPLQNAPATSSDDRCAHTVSAGHAVSLEVR